jgi:hypothetical protein
MRALYKVGEHSELFKQVLSKRYTKSLEEKINKMEMRKDHYLI